MSFSQQFGEPEFKTVSEYTRELKTLLENGVQPCWIRGEVSNFRQQASGHCYFTLKDEGAQLPAVMFRGNAAGLGFELDNGVEVLAYGEISVYEPYGRYQLIVRAMEESGSGKLHHEFERLKRKLREEGLFESDRKKELPRMPRRIAFVTSASGAAAQDFIRILKRRGWIGRLSIIPSKVQGKGAAEEIVEGIRLVESSQLFDLIVVGRGGGSIEDLWCFNEEIVARAIAACSVPIISAVGHEIDFTLADFAADKRAETPSGAAELISSSFIECVDRLRNAFQAFEESIAFSIGESRLTLQGYGDRMRRSSPKSRIEKSQLLLDDASNRLHSNFNAQLACIRQAYWNRASRFAGLDPKGNLQLLGQRRLALAGRIDGACQLSLGRFAFKADNINARLETLNPLATLKRGYAVLSLCDGGIVSSVERIPETDPLKATMRDGEAWLEKTKGPVPPSLDKGGDSGNIATSESRPKLYRD